MGRFKLFVENKFNTDRRKPKESKPEEEYVSHVTSTPKRNDAGWGYLFSKKLTAALGKNIRWKPTPEPVNTVSIAFMPSDSPTDDADNILIITKHTSGGGPRSAEVTHAGGVFKGHENEINALLRADKMIWDV